MMRRIAQQPLASVPTRGLLHFAAVAAAGKVAGGLLLKKFAMSRVVQKIGAQRIIQE